MDDGPSNGAHPGFDFSQALEEEAQSVAAALRNREASRWVFGEPAVEARWLDLIGTGYECVRSQPPNLVAAREILNRAEAALDARVKNMHRDNLWQRWGMAALAALLIGSLALAWLVPQGAVVVGIPVWVFLFGAAGGSASGLAALRGPIACTRHGKLAVVTAGSRTFLGALTGAMVYLLFASGAISITVGTDPHLFHALAALAGGFSERLLGRAVGQAISFLGDVAGEHAEANR
jgi:hypothetical protein